MVISERQAAFELMAVDGTMIPVIAALHACCFAAPWSAASCARVMAMPGAFGLVATTRARAAGGDAVPVGFVLARVAGAEAEILSLGVDPAWRGRGAGTALMTAVLARAGAAGAEEVFLEVAESNRPALGLYHGLGFVRVGRRPGYYRSGAGSGENAITLRAALPAPARRP